MDKIIIPNMQRILKVQMIQINEIFFVADKLTIAFQVTSTNGKEKRRKKKRKRTASMG